MQANLIWKLSTVKKPLIPVIPSECEEFFRLPNIISLFGRGTRIGETPNDRKLGVRNDITAAIGSPGMLLPSRMAKGPRDFVFSTDAG